MDYKNEIPEGMKGVFKGTDTVTDGQMQKRQAIEGLSRLRRGELPPYWGIDAVMIPLVIWLTILVIRNWDAILLTVAQVIADALIYGTVLLVIVMIVLAVIAIRNKRIW